MTAKRSRRLRTDRLQEALDEVWARQPMTKEERAWADKILRVVTLSPSRTRSRAACLPRK